MAETEYDVLITGGCGFIGTAVADYLLNHGKYVVCFDSHVDSSRLDTSAPQLSFVEGDILDNCLVDQWVTRCSRVIHLAALVGVDKNTARPLELLDINILGTRNVLLSCLRHDRPVLIASTSEIHGKNCDLLHEKSDRVYGPSSTNRWCYPISKSAGEQYAYALAMQGLKFVAVRYFNVYGPQMDTPGIGGVVCKFLGYIRDGKPLQLVDGGDAVRSFCYIDDAAEATARLVLGIGSTAQYRSSSFNVGRNEPISIRKLADWMIELSGHNHGIVNVEAETHFGSGFEDIPYRVPDVELLARAIGFRAQTELRTGLVKTLEYWGLLKPAPAQTASQQELAAIIPEIKPDFEPDKALTKRIHLMLKMGQVTNAGPHMRRFEGMMTEYLGMPAAALSSGYDALTLALRAFGVPGKAVLPSYTFNATLNAVLDNGLQPVFRDIDTARFTMSVSGLEQILARETDVRYVIPVNVFGVPPDLTAIANLTQQAGALLVYDNAHGMGTVAEGVNAPVQPIAQTFSFHATKTLPAVEGGLLSSKDESLIAEVCQLRNHGIARDVLDSRHGVNAKLDELRAIIAIHSFKRFESILERRRYYGSRLTARLRHTGPEGFFIPQYIPGSVRTNYQNLGVLCPQAEKIGFDTIVNAFKLQGVGCRSYFNPPLHRLHRYSNRFELPATDRVWRTLISLPMHSRMSEQVLSRIELAASNVAKQFGQKNVCCETLDSAH